MLPDWPEQWRKLRGDGPVAQTSYTEIGRRYGVSPNTVKNYVGDGKSAKRGRPPKRKVSKEKYNEYKKEWRATAPKAEREREASRQWKERNRERVRQYDRDYNARKKWEREGRQSAPTPKRCACAVPLREEGLCGWCGRSLPEEAPRLPHATTSPLPSHSPRRAVGGGEVRDG